MWRTGGKDVAVAALLLLVLMMAGATSATAAAGAFAAGAKARGSAAAAAAAACPRVVAAGGRRRSGVVRCDAGVEAQAQAAAKAASIAALEQFKISADRECYAPFAHPFSPFLLEFPAVDAIPLGLGNIRFCAGLAGGCAN